MRIDHHLGEFDVEELHSIDIAAPQEIVYRAMRGLDLWDVGVIRFLFGLRELPARLLGRDGPRQKMDFDALCELGFTFLDERPNEEFVLGIVAKFWSLVPAPVAVEADEFKTRRMPGFCKAAWNFDFQKIPEGTRVTTRTRVEMGSRVAGGLFRVYWFFVAPFSGLVRRQMLKHLRNKVESSQELSVEVHSHETE